MIREKKVFATVREALAALGRDRLSSVWFSAGKVTVHTAFGTGVFTAKDWWAGGGPKSSMDVQVEVGCRAVAGCVRMHGHSGFHTTVPGIAEKEDASA